MENKELNQKIEELREELEQLIVYLDEDRDCIWNLKEKDFEDLRHSIRTYDDRVESAYDLLIELKSLLRKRYEKDFKREIDLEYNVSNQVSDYNARIDYHMKERDYFSPI